MTDSAKAERREARTLTDVRRVLPGHAEIKQNENTGAHIIDCDAQPFAPNGWKVEEHRKGGQFEWDPAQVRLHLSVPQQKGKWIRWIAGHKLREELSGLPVLNANVLDHLLAYPHLIPEEWKGNYIFFWGTIYRDPSGLLGVRCLDWCEGRWGSSYGWLGLGFLGRRRPAALRTCESC